MSRLAWPSSGWADKVVNWGEMKNSRNQQKVKRNFSRVKLPRLRWRKYMVHRIRVTSVGWTACWHFWIEPNLAESVGACGGRFLRRSEKRTVNGEPLEEYRPTYARPEKELLHASSGQKLVNFIRVFSWSSGFCANGEFVDDRGGRRNMWWKKECTIIGGRRKKTIRLGLDLSWIWCFTLFYASFQSKPILSAWKIPSRSCGERKIWTG